MSLSLIQGANYLLPIITMPYIVRTVGVEKYGLVSLSLAFAQYFIIITEYGFNYSATREISVNRDNKQLISKIFSAVTISKSILFVVSSLLFVFILFSFNIFNQHRFLYLLTFGIVFGKLLYPTWYFQGIEKMKYLTILDLIVKICFALLLFIFIRSPKDYILIPVLYSLTYFLETIVSLCIVIFIFKIRIILPSLNDIYNQFKNGWYIFISSIGITSYKTNVIFILGLFTTEIIVGYFSIAKKVIDLVNQVSGIISQSVYPYITSKIHSKTEDIQKILKYIQIIIIIYTVTAGIMLLLNSSIIIDLISNSNNIEAINSLKIMAFVPLIIGINVPPLQILLAKKKDGLFSKIILIGTLIDICMNFILIPRLSYFGAAYSVVITEFMVTLMLLITARNVRE